LGQIFGPEFDASLASILLSGHAIFNVRRITRQTYLNSIILGLHEFGPEFEDRAYEVGATILKTAERAAEVDVDPYAARHQLFLAQQAQTQGKAKKQDEPHPPGTPREVQAAYHKPEETY